MRYLLGGYYGMRNVGDDVLLYVTLAGIMRLDPAATFTVISDRPETVPPGAAITITPGGRRFENVRQMARHDVWVFGGGGLLQDRSARSLSGLTRLAQSARVVKLMGRPVVLLGIGIGPLATPDGRRAARRLLRLADLVTVRDDESLELASKLASDANVHVTADLAFLLPELSTPVATSDRRPTGARILGISLLPYAGSLGRDAQADVRTTERVATELNAVLERRPEWNVRLFQFFAGSTAYDDAAVLKLLERTLARPERVTYRGYDGDFASLRAELAACDAFLGMRFHSCLLAYLAEVPCLMISYHPKSDSLARRLRLSAEAVAALPVLEAPGALSARIEALLSDGAKFRPTVALDEVTSAAARNFALLGDWLQRKRGRSS